MDKFQEAIGEYEMARQSVSDLKKQRLSLLDECTEMWEHGNCLYAAYAAIREEGEQDEYGHHGSFEDELESGEYCESCRESYRIKKGPLAEARAKFGNAKRKLSRLGKRVIAEATELTKESDR